MADHGPASASLLEDEEQFWNGIYECVAKPCDTHEAIDDILRAWLDLATQLLDRSLEPQEDLVACAHVLLESRLFQGNKDYVRTQIIYSLLQEDETRTLRAIISLLLLDGYYDETLFPCMIDALCFPRLLELMHGRRRDENPQLHQLLLHLMYEMSRLERLRLEDLMLVDDAFIHSLFGIVEGVADDVADPYHYPTIRVLLVLNEQYMLASTDSATLADPGSPTTPLTNRIVKCLSLHGPSFRTFGENVILLLNRETETSLQLLILKLLYLLFTTKSTYEYFYTNDLRVLLDVIIRNLMDLPDEKISLRHTYLRVLYPLLAHTPLAQPPHYKSDEILRALRILRGSQNAHFAPADETTLRLVDRVSKVKWLETAELESRGGGSGEAELARKFLGISLSQSQAASKISVGDVAGVMEKPGVQTPSRYTVVATVAGPGTETTAAATAEARAERGGEVSIAVPTQEEVAQAVRSRRPLPAVPKHRHGTPFQPTVEPQGNGEAKKIPPKTPPPRRWGRMRSAAVPPVEPLQET